MTRKQTMIAWGVSLLLSALLFHLGVMAPFSARAELARVERTRELLPPWEMPRFLEQLDQLRERGVPNYYLGVAVPLALLGMCAFLSAGPAHQTHGRPQAAVDRRRNNGIGGGVS